MKKLFFLIVSLAVMAVCTQNSGSEISYYNVTDGRILASPEINRTNYPDLTLPAIIWGNGDGSTTFNIPDLRGMFLRGVSGDSKNDFISY